MSIEVLVSILKFLILVFAPLTVMPSFFNKFLIFNKLIMSFFKKILLFAVFFTLNRFSNSFSQYLKVWALTPTIFETSEVEKYFLLGIFSNSICSII